MTEKHNDLADRQTGKQADKYSIVITHTLFGKEILVKDYFVDILGRPALNMGVFVGIIAGFVGAMGLVKKDNGIQAIYGPKADMLKSEINDIL